MRDGGCTGARCRHNNRTVSCRCSWIPWRASASATGHPQRRERQDGNEAQETHAAQRPLAIPRQYNQTHEAGNQQGIKYFAPASGVALV